MVTYSESAVATKKPNWTEDYSWWVKYLNEKETILEESCGMWKRIMLTKRGINDTIWFWHPMLEGSGWSQSWTLAVILGAKGIVVLLWPPPNLSSEQCLLVRLEFERVENEKLKLVEFWTCQTIKTTVCCRLSLAEDGEIW